LADPASQAVDAVDYGAIAADATLPPLGDVARRLLSLSDDEAHDARLLALIAQRDPVHLARLLALANGAARGLSRRVTTADEAIQVVGTRDAHAAMLSLALAASFPGGEDRGALRPWLLRHSVNLALTVRRVVSFLALDDDRAATLLMAALFDPLGVHAALVVDHPHRRMLLDAVRAHASAHAWWPGDLPQLQGYRRLSAAVARRWGALPEVVVLLEAPWRPLPGQLPADAALLWLCHRLLASRLQGDGDFAALLAEPHALPSDVVARLSAERPFELAFAA